MKVKITFIAFFLYVLITNLTSAQNDIDSGAKKKTGIPTITITKMDVSDKNLRLSYEIRNDSQQEFWILAGFDEVGATIELFMDEDDRTLMIRRRFNVPFSGGGNTPPGRYVVLRSGKTLTESVTLAIPVYPEYGFAMGQQRQAQGLEYAKRLAIEIGYYASDLPRIIRRTNEEVDRIGFKVKSEDDRIRRFYFRGVVSYNALSEILRQRDEEVLLPYTYQWFKGEQILRTVVEDVNIPYEEKEDWQRQSTLYIPPCSRVEIQYRPSMLEYFFPYVGQQKLLSPSEKQSLQSEKTIVVEDQQALKTFVNYINEGLPLSASVRERTMAQVICYHDDETKTSFNIYNDYSIVKDFRDRFIYMDGFPILRILTPQIQPLELRICCAANLRNLWHRLRLYYKARGEIEILYPLSTEWCDAVREAYESRGMLDKYIESPHKCPSAGEGENHYAMNPNCEPNSPPDMVLLF